MEFLKQECDEIKEIDATVKFIRTIDDIFDIKDSTTSIRRSGLKRPMTKS